MANGGAKRIAPVHAQRLEVGWTQGGFVMGRYSRLWSCVSLALLLAACGSDNGHPAATPTATRPATTATATVSVPASTPTNTASVAGPSATVTRPANDTPTATLTAQPSATSSPTVTATEPPTPSPTNPVLSRTPDAVIALGVPGGATYVAFDSLGMPHIYGPTLDSVLFVQGYETAKARFWQMDAFRRAAEGRLSELFGTATLSMDLQMRTAFTTRDGGRLEEELWQRVQAEEPGLAATAQAYADGINQWLADLRAGRNSATLPPEYTLVDVTAKDLAPWRPQDTLAIGRLQAWTLSETLDQELFFARVFSSLPEALREDVFRSAPAAPATVLPSPGTTAAISRAAEVQAPALP